MQTTKAQILAIFYLLVIIGVEWVSQFYDTFRVWVLQGNLQKGLVLPQFVFQIFNIKQGYQHLKKI
jgi:hypothetical protein